MHLFPKEVIEHYISKYITNDYHINPNEDWININSVFTEDSKYKMGFCISKNYVNDFKLGQSWRIVDFVAEYEEISSELAKAKLMNIYFKFRKSNKLEFTSAQKPKIVQAIDLEEIDHKHVPPTKEFDKESIKNKVGRKVLKYLFNRGFSFKHIKKYKLKYVDHKECWICYGSKEIDGDKCWKCKGSGMNFYHERVLIPTYENGNLVYFQGRSIEKEGEWRYMNPKIPRLQISYFYDLIEENKPIYITEGPFDAMTLYDYNCTCLMANRISDPQIFKLLNKNPTEIIFVPDYDETEDKRKIIFKAMKKNIDRIKNLSNGTVKIGIYKWFKKWKGKDVNSAGVTYIDPSLIFYLNSVKQQLEEKFNG